MMFMQLYKRVKFQRNVVFNNILNLILVSCRYAKVVIIKMIFHKNPATKWHILSTDTGAMVRDSSTFWYYFHRDTKKPSKSLIFCVYLTLIKGTNSCFSPPWIMEVNSTFSLAWFLFPIVVWDGLMLSKHGPLRPVTWVLLSKHF